MDTLPPAGLPWLLASAQDKIHKGDSSNANKYEADCKDEIHDPFTPSVERRFLPPCP